MGHEGPNARDVRAIEEVLHDEPADAARGAGDEHAGG